MRWLKMTEYYVDASDDLASRLKQVEDEVIINALRNVADEEAPPSDKVINSKLSQEEKKRRRLRQIRRNGTSPDTRPDYE